MKRHISVPRENWAKSVEAIGFDFHTSEAAKYWTEDAYWEFTADEIDMLEEAGNELHGMALSTVDRCIREHRLAQFGIMGFAAELVQESWAERTPNLYGRLDLAYDGSGPPKLLEYNADTPTSLFEAAIVQWYWKNEICSGTDQFNSIEETIIERFRAFMRGIPTGDPRRVLHLAWAMPNLEDGATCQYLGACAQDAEFQVKTINMADIGWHDQTGRFVDLDGDIIHRIFKLYPWEWLIREDFGKNIRRSGTQFIEPPWKMLLSNKALLPAMWDQFPFHKNLLPASFQADEIKDMAEQGLVRKAILGREGRNIAIYDRDGKVLEETDGHYGEDGSIWQARADLAKAGQDGTAVLGVWIVGDEACGLGIREADGLITTDQCRFVPHIFPSRHIQGS